MDKMTEYYKPEIFAPVRQGIQAFLAEVSRENEHPVRALGRVFDPIDSMFKIYYKQVLNGKPVSTHVIGKLMRRLVTYVVSADLIPVVFTEEQRKDMRLLPIFVSTMDFTGYAVIPIKMVSTKQWESPHGELQVVSLTELLTGPPTDTSEYINSIRGL